MKTLENEIIKALEYVDTPYALSMRLQCPTSILMPCLENLQTNGLVVVDQEESRVYITDTMKSFHQFNLEPSDSRKARIQKILSFFEKSDYPTVLLGSGTAIWDNIQHYTCPACGGRELCPEEYCLMCDKWGMDEYNANIGNVLAV